MEPSGDIFVDGTSLHADAEIGLEVGDGQAITRLRPGDRLITGSIVQGPVSAGDEIVADFGSLESVRLAVA